MEQAPRANLRDNQPGRDVHGHHDIKLHCSSSAFITYSLFKVDKVVLSFGIFRSKVMDEDKFAEFFIFIDLRMSWSETCIDLDQWSLALAEFWVIFK